MQDEIHALQESAKNTADELHHSVAELQTDISGTRSSLMAALDQARVGLETAIDSTSNACQASIKEVAQISEQTAHDLVGRIDAEVQGRLNADEAAMEAAAQNRAAAQQLSTELRGIATRFDLKVRALEEQQGQYADDMQETIRKAIDGLEEQLAAHANEMTSSLSQADARLAQSIEQQGSSLREELGELQMSLQKENNVTRSEMMAALQKAEESTAAILTGIREDMESSAQELSQLQEETSATLTGFREYINSALEAESSQRDELRDELKSVIEGAFTDAKFEFNEAVSASETQTRAELQEEMSSSSARLEGEIKKLHEQTRNAIEALDEQLIECQAVGRDAQALRVLLTTGEERTSRLDQFVRKNLQELKTQETACTAELQQISSKLDLTTSTADNAAASVVELSAAQNVLGTRADAVDARQQKLSEELQSLEETANNTMRVAVSRLEEKTARIAGRLNQCESEIHEMRPTLKDHTEAIPAIEKRLSESIFTVVGKLEEGIGQIAEKNETELSAMRSEISMTAEDQASRLQTLREEHELHVEHDVADKTELAQNNVLISDGLESFRAQAKADHDALESGTNASIAAVTQKIDDDVQTLREHTDEVAEQHSKRIDAANADIIVTVTQLEETEAALHAEIDAAQKLGAENLAAAQDSLQESVTELQEHTDEVAELQSKEIDAANAEIRATATHLEAKLEETETNLRTELDAAQKLSADNLAAAQGSLEEAGAKADAALQSLKARHEEHLEHDVADKESIRAHMHELDETTAQVRSRKATPLSPLSPYYSDARCCVYWVT